MDYTLRFRLFVSRKLKTIETINKLNLFFPSFNYVIIIPIM